MRPFADGGREELLPGFGSVTGLERGLLGYRSDLLNPRERPKGRAEFMKSLEEFYTVRFLANCYSGLQCLSINKLICISANRTLRGQLGM